MKVDFEWYVLIKCKKVKLKGNVEGIFEMHVKEIENVSLKCKFKGN